MPRKAMVAAIAVVATLAIGAALGGLVWHVSPTARTVLAWTALLDLYAKTANCYIKMHAR